MFDLSKSLRDWQEQMRRGEGCSHEDIDELEEHLHEEMVGLTQAGLSREEAFLLATRRLGKVEVLNEEFGKVNTRFVWLNRLRWMAGGVLIYLGASTAEATFRRVLMTGGAMVGLNSYVAGVLIPLASIAVMALIAVLAVKVVARRRMEGQGSHPCTLATKCRLLLGVLLWFTLLPFGAAIMVAFACRYVSPSDMGRMAIATSFGQSVLSVVLPLVIAGWVLKTRRWSY